jgi:DNA-binding beta-propeller fold protein YncE
MPALRDHPGSHPSRGLRETCCGTSQPDDITRQGSNTNRAGLKQMAIPPNFIKSDGWRTYNRRVAVDPGTHTVYVTNFDDGTVSVIESR